MKSQNLMWLMVSKVKQNLIIYIADTVQYSAIVSCPITYIVIETFE